MPRGLPWTNYQNAVGERPVFFIELAMAHQTVSLGQYDSLPGPIQGRVQSWDDVFFQNRSGQDSLNLKLVNAPSNAIGKAIRCRGAWEIDVGTPFYDGSFAYWLPSSGTPFVGIVDHSFMVLVRAWQIASFPASPAADAFIAFKSEHFRITVSALGTIKLEMNTGSGWQTIATDVEGLVEGELCAVGFSYVQSTQTATYMRRSDSGDYSASAVVVDPDHSSGAWPIVFNGDTDSAIANAGTEGRFCTWLDVDEARWWNRAITLSQFQAMARRTLLPSEGLDANLVAWSRFDEGTGSSCAVVSRTGATITGTLSFENTHGTLGNPSAPAWISGLTRDRITDQIQAAYPIEGWTVSLKVTFTDPVTNAPVELFRGVVSEMPSASRLIAEFQCVDVSTKAHKMIGTLVDKASWPTAPNDSVGKTIPLVFGSVPSVPGLRVAAAASTRVTASFLTGDSSCSVASTTDFPATGTIRIDDEEITYSGKTATTFTGLTRGANSTIATSHVTGAQVVEVTGETYLFSDHAVTSLTNVRKVNSRGEAIPAAGSEFTATLTAPARVVFLKPPRVEVRGEGSLWLEIDMEAASAYNTALNPEFACALHASWTETNFATISAAAPRLSIERTSGFDGPVPAKGVLKAYVVVEHHGLPATGGPLVSVTTTVSNVLLGSLGFLVAQTNTPDRALQQGQYHAESAGFDAAHQHEIPGSVHEHQLGQDSTSVVIRPLGSNFWWARPILFTPTFPSGSAIANNYPTYQASQFYTDTPDPVTDGDQDTFNPMIGVDGKLTFANLSGTNRGLLRARIVAVCSAGAAGNRFDLVVKGTPISAMSLGLGAPVPMANTAAGTAGRTTYTGNYVDISPLNLKLIDLVRPDSFLRITGSGANVWEIYLEVEVDRTAPSTRTARPAYDNWPKVLDKVRDGNYRSFEPSVFPCPMSGLLPLGPGGTAPFQHLFGWINPNPPVNGPDLPFNNQVQPNLRFYFTELDEPFAELQEAALVIAHSNSHAAGPHMVGFAPTKLPVTFVGAGVAAPSPWNPLSSAVPAPRYQVRLVIKGVLIGTFSFSLDMADATPPVYYDPAAVPSGQVVGAFTRGAGGIVSGNLEGARVESTSGWRSLLGQAPGGTNFKVQDLIDQNSYVEILMPPPTPIDMVDQISPGPPTDTNYLQQFSVYDAQILSMARGCMKLFDVRLEYRSEEIEQTAQTVDVGNTDAKDALRHSSLTWFDITALWLAVGDWNALKDIEFNCIGAFGANEMLRILRVGAVIEYGTVGFEDTSTIIADVDQGGGGNPIDHVERIFDTYLGSSYKSAAAFTVAKALVRTDAAGVVLERIGSAELIDRILRQYSCSWIWEAGLFLPQFKPMFSAIAAGAVTLDVNAIVRNSLILHRTPREEVVTQLDVLYALDYLKKGWGGKTTRDSAGGQAAYGIIRGVLEGDWIRTAAAAAAWADTELEYRDHVSALMVFACYLNALNVVRGDIVQVSHDLRSTTKGEVLEMSLAPGGRGRPPLIRLVVADRTESL